jgi:virginiamycin B lyase
MLPPSLQTASLRKARSPVRQNPRASAARSAAGRPVRKITGSVSAVIRGIPLIREASAQRASTSGLKRSAFLAADGRHTQTGTPTEKQTRSVMFAIRRDIALPILLFLLARIGAVATQPANAPKPGVKGLQVPFAALKSSARLRIGGTADWVLVTGDAVWVAGTKPYSVQHIDPITNRIVAKIALPAEACSGLAFGFGSVWVPVCGKKPALVRVDAQQSKVIATLPIPPAGKEGGIATSIDSVWMVTDKAGTLNRIDPSTNSVRQKIRLPPGSYNPLFSDGIVWITGVESGVVTAVDADTGKVLESVPVGPKPRFFTAGAGSIWTLNQGDGTVTRVDEKNRKVIATIQVGIPGAGGDIGYGADSVWPTVFDVPLTRIDATTNRVVKQWTGKGGDSLRFGFGSLWITDYKRGLLSRIPIQQVQ